MHPTRFTMPPTAVRKGSRRWSGRQSRQASDIIFILTVMVIAVGFLIQLAIRFLTNGAAG